MSNTDLFFFLLRYIHCAREYTKILFLNELNTGFTTPTYYITLQLKM